MRNLILFISTILLSQIGLAQDFDKAKLNDYFDTLQAHNKFMGSVAVSKEGEVIYKRSLGFADIENNVKANENTRYRIGSISKTFTAVLVFKAIEEGKLKLQQNIANFFPSIKNAENITIDQLLSHRSGIHSFTQDDDYLNWNTQPKSEKEMVAIISKGGSDFEPDSKTEYSNSNYVLLTYILEKSFKKSYSDLLKRYITKPLGLKSTYLGSRINVSKNESQSYAWEGDWELQPETDMSIPLGAGGVVSTPVDLVKFSDALFNGRLLKEESVAQMKTIRDGLGRGLFQFPFDGRTGYGHTGGIDGFSSVFTHFDDGDISYALTSNGANFNNNNISIAVLSAVYGESYDLPEISAIELKSEDLDQYLGEYTSSQIPLGITITKNGATLIAQATGQSSFPLEATEKDTFKFDAAGLVMEFDPANDSFVLKQGDGVFTFFRE